MKNLSSCLKMFLWLTLVTGVFYPLLITVIAQISMHDKARGSFVTVNGKIVGSSLIAQKFASEKYFWARPSACDYNPLPSGASNLGPTSGDLKKLVDTRLKRIIEAHGSADIKEVPSALLYASGSGLDPHITKGAAHFQIKRIATARGLSAKKLEALIEKMVEKRGCGFIGEECVNVLLLNIALDKNG
jgi:potassium-transporting ATPase KdpC subunit